MAPSNYIPKIIEIDEIYIKIQGNREFYGWLAYDAENRYLIDFVTGKRDDDTLEELFKKLKKYKGKTELVLIDAYKGYEKFIEKYLTDGKKKPFTGVINKSQYTKTEGFVTYALFGQSKQSVENKMASLGLGGKITTALIECLNSQIRDLCNYMRRRSKRIPRLLTWGEKAISCFKFLHNFLKAHLTLSEKSSKNWITVPVTPCMKAGICNHQISLIEILTFRFYTKVVGCPFNVTVNQMVKVSGYLNDSLLFTNESVTNANCTLHAEVVGEHNVSAIASNANGTDMQTWIWNVSAAPLPVLEITKTDAPDPVSPGGTLNYSIRVNNTGNATATNVTVTETYDKNVTFVAAEPAPSSGDDTWQFPTLNVSETRWINISVSVNVSVLNGTVLHNIVNVSCDEWFTDSDTENTTVFVAPVCVETATGTGNACFVTDSGTIEDLVAVDESTLPEEGKPELVFHHGFFSFNITGLTQGQTVVVTLTLPDIVPVGTEYWKYHASEGGWIRIPMGSDDGDNEITITLVDGGLGDDDDTANGVIVDQGGPGVRAIKPELTKSAPTSVAPGGTITYTILYANVGLSNLTDVTITENYPEYVTFISADPAPDAGTNNMWTIGTLQAGASGQITIKVKVPDSRDLSFTESGSVTGEGFVMVSKDLSTEQKLYRLKNVVTISCAETDPVTASASTTVSGVPGTSLEITEHGSGIYASEEILNLGTKNKSIRLQKSTDAEYQPTSFNFSDGFSVVFTNMWMQEICSKNMVLGDAMHKKIKDATYIKDETKTETGEYGTSMEFASSFHGAAHIGAVSKDVTTSEDYIGEFELFWVAKEECQYIFNWSRVPGNDSEKLIRFLVDTLDINLYWAENATITKSDDDRIINISTDWHSAEVILAADNETATVEVGGETIYVLDVRTEDGSLNVYDCRLRKILESVDGEGYVMVDKELTSGHIQVVEHGSGIYSSDTDFDSQRLNKSTEAEYQPTTFNFSDGFGVNFSSKWVQGICSKDKKAGTAIHKKISDATSIADDTTATKSSMAFETSFNGSIHIGARATGTRISEDYIGVFNITEKIEIGKVVNASTATPVPDWLPCPFPEP